MIEGLAGGTSPAINDEGDVRIKGNPFHGLSKVRPRHALAEAHPAWTDEEVTATIEAALHRKQPGLARAIALGRWGGFRRQTICKLPLAARTKSTNGSGVQETRLIWITEKRRVLCDKREDPRLTELLERTPNLADTIAYNAYGRPFKERQLNQALDRLTTHLAELGKVRAATKDTGQIYCPLDLHGLRHARGNEIATSGGSDAEIMTQLEHATDRAAKIYRRQADRRRMADAAQDRIDLAVRLRAPRSA